MIFVKDRLKFDTDKMKFVSYKCRVIDPNSLSGGFVDCKLYKSKKGNWLGVYESDNTWYSVRMTEDQAIDMLLAYDVGAYERIFGELEEG